MLREEDRGPRKPRQRDQGENPLRNALYGLWQQHEREAGECNGDSVNRRVLMVCPTLVHSSTGNGKLS